MKLRVVTWLSRPDVMRVLRNAAAVGVSALLVLLFLHKVDWGQVWQTMQRMRLLYLVPIAALFLFSYWLQAARWHYLVRHIANVSTRDAFPRVLVSNTAGVVLPFQLGQVLMVQISAEKFNIGRTELFGAEFISRLMDGFVFALFLAVSLATLPIGSSFTDVTLFMLSGTSLGFALVWGVTRRHPHLLENGHGRITEWLRHAHETVLHPLLDGLSSIQDPRQTLDIFLLSVAIWGTEAGFYWVTGLSLGLHVNPLAYLFLVAAANIGAGIPLAQAGIGFIFLAQQAFVSVGQSREVATAYALSLQALIVAPVVVLGPLAIYSMHLHWRDVLPGGRGKPPLPPTESSEPPAEHGAAPSHPR